MSKPPIGYMVTQTWCRECAPEGVRDYHTPMREGDDHGVPYSCDVCGEDLLPCAHEWNDWRPAFTPRGGSPQQVRFCTAGGCGEAEYRPLVEVEAA